MRFFRIMKHNNADLWPQPANRIANLKPNTPVKDLELLILRIYPQRLLVSGSYTGPVAAACGRDDTGLVGVVLWAEQVDDVQLGDVIRLHSGWCRSRDGALVVSTGRHGRMSVLRGADDRRLA